MGILDWLETPQGMGLLSAAAGAMAGARKGRPWNTAGIGLTTGLGGYAMANDQIRKASDDEFAKQYKSLQMQEIQDKIAKAQAERKWRAGLPEIVKNRTQTVAPNENTQLMAGAMGSQAAPEVVDNSHALQDYLMQPESPYAEKLIEQQFLPQDPIKIGAGDVLLDPVTKQPVYTAPPSADKSPDKVRQYEYAKSQGYNGTFVDFLKIVPELNAAAMYPWRAAEANDRGRARDIDERKADYELPAPRKPQRSNGVNVTAPDGATYSFPSQQQADAFMRAIGGR